MCTYDIDLQSVANKMVRGISLEIRDNINGHLSLVGILFHEPFDHFEMHHNIPLMKEHFCLDVSVIGRDDSVIGRDDWS